jgi:hypothetical protein
MKGAMNEDIQMMHPFWEQFWTFEGSIPSRHFPGLRI